MAMTILEAAKRNPGEVLRNGIVQMWAEESPILGVLPFEDIEGGAYRHNREQALPGVGFRGVNEAFTESVGVLNPVVETLTIAGGDLDVDKFIVRTQGGGARSTHTRLKVKALAHRWTETFIKGDSETEPREFDGLQKRVSGSQLIAAGNSSGGDALSIAKLDEARDAVREPTHWIMNRTMRRLLTQGSRKSTVDASIERTVDQFGRQIELYDGLPILVLDEDEQGNDILPFTEANPGGGAAASTSIYCVAFRPGWITGLQNGGIDVEDLGELDTKPVLRTRCEWYSAFTILNGRAVSRVHGIKNAAVVA